MRWVALTGSFAVIVVSTTTAFSQERARPHVDQIVREFPFPPAAADEAKAAPSPLGESRVAPAAVDLAEEEEPAATSPQVDSETTDDAMQECCPCPDGADDSVDAATTRFNRTAEHFARRIRSQLIEREQALFELEAKRQTRLLVFTRQLELERQREVEQQFNTEVERFLRARAFMTNLAREREPSGAPQ